MRFCFAFVFLSLTFVRALPALLQDAKAEKQPDAGVVLTELSPPVYPPLARQAGIAGEVTVHVLIRTNGTVESAEVISGHPMLKPAALKSAEKSKFECKGCSGSASSYSLTYTFGFQDHGCKEVVNERGVRSAKCLYLWKCGLRRSTSWEQPEFHAPQVIQTPSRVTVLVSSECVQAETYQSK